MVQQYGRGQNDVPGSPGCSGAPWWSRDLHVVEHALDALAHVVPVAHEDRVNARTREELLTTPRLELLIAAPSEVVEIREVLRRHHLWEEDVWSGRGGRKDCRRVGA